MMKRLNAFSKIRLTWRAYRDVRNQEFYSVSRQQPNKAADVIDGAAKPSEDMTLAVSPFLFAELAALKARTEYVVARKPRLYWLNTKRGHKYYLRSTLNVVMSRIDDQRLRLTADISAENQQFKKDSEELATKRGNYEQRGEAQMVQLCFNQYNKLRKDYVKETIAKYKRVVRLLTQKLNILAAVNDRLKYIRSRRFHRIRYYYLKAAYYSVNLPKAMPTDEDLLLLAGLGNGEVYADERSKTESLLSGYMEQINKS